MQAAFMLMALMESIWCSYLLIFASAMALNALVVVDPLNSRACSLEKVGLCLTQPSGSANGGLSRAGSDLRSKLPPCASSTSQLWNLDLQNLTDSSPWTSSLDCSSSTTPNLQPATDRVLILSIEVPRPSAIPFLPPLRSNATFLPLTLHLHTW
jgi:hypothetical protein